MTAAGVQRVAVVGTGVIGASWAAQFLARGLDVVATDPAPGAEERLRADVAAHWPSAGSRSPGRRPDRLTFTADPARPRREADFVQENGPEREDVKHALFAVLDEAARPEVVLASSSSGLLPTVIARGCPRHPERVRDRAPVQPAAPHPAGRGGAGGEDRRGRGRARRWRSTPRSGSGRSGCARSCPGHVANRLQAALWQEAYSLVERGRGHRRRHRHRDLPRPRPALGGARAVPQPAPLRRAGRHRARSSSTSARPPRRGGATCGQVTLTPELIAKLVAGVDDELAGIDPAELVARRDAVLTALLAAKARTDLP